MQPIEHLMMEHRLMAQAVSVTKQFRNEIKTGGPIRPKRYWMLTDFWSTFADIVHHGKEEQYLFPAIIEQKAASEFNETIDKLVEEHMWLLGYISDLRRYARPMFTGDRLAREKVIECLDNYIELTIPHIQLEDKELFPAISKILSKKEMTELAKEFKMMDARVGPKIHDYYSNLVDTLLTE